LAISRTGNIDAWFGLPYGIWFYVVTFGGRFIFLSGLLQAGILLYTLNKLLETLFSTRKYLVMNVLFFTPVFWIFALTLYHDVLFLCGVFLLIDMLIRAIDDPQTQSKIDKKESLRIAIIGILLNMRLNAIAWIVSGIALIIFVSIFSPRVRRAFKLLTVVSLMTTGISLVNLLSNSGISQEAGTQAVRHFLTADILCWQSSGQYQVKNEKTTFSNPCASIDGIYVDEKSRSYLDKDQSMIINEWSKILISNPAFILGTHMKRMWILFPQYFIPPYEQVEWRSELLPNPPKPDLTEAVFLSFYDLEEDLFPDRNHNPLFLIVSKYGGLWNQLAFVTVGVGIQMLLPLFLFLWKKSNNYLSGYSKRLILLSLLVYLCATLALLPASPAPDVRLVYPVILINYFLFISLGIDFFRIRLIKNLS
jgi:hypothetical protein